MDKIERAKLLLDEAEKSGCKPKLNGNWVVFTPPLSVDLLMEASDLGEELATLIGATHD